MIVRLCLLVRILEVWKSHRKLLLLLLVIKANGFTTSTVSVKLLKTPFLLDYLILKHTKSLLLVKVFPMAVVQTGSVLLHTMTLSVELLQIKHFWVSVIGIILRRVYSKLNTWVQPFIQRLLLTVLTLLLILENLPSFNNLLVLRYLRLLKILQTRSNFLSNLLQTYLYPNNTVTDGIGNVVLYLRIHAPVYTSATWMDAVKNIADANTLAQHESRCFMRGLEWDSFNPQGFSSAIKSSFHSPPLPDPPPLADDPNAAFAIKCFPHLFKITTPFKVNLIEKLSLNHPNQPFIKSVIKGLHQGFCPMLSIPSSKIDNFENHSSCFLKPHLLDEQCADEVSKGRYSQVFHTVLTGMKVAPLCLVPKKNPDKVCVCSNMSFGEPSPNSLVDHSQICISMDSLISFAPFLINRKKKCHDLILWKSDVDSAYRNRPMSPQ